MAVEVKLPQLGESTYEGTIGKWLKKPGDRVQRYESLVEIITDKVNVEMPSPFEGTLTQILVPEGQTVPTGTPIALMDTGDGAGATEVAAPPAVKSASPAPSVQERPRSEDAAEERTRLSPVVRKLAQEHGIGVAELEQLSGSGAGGRVTKEDVLAYLETRQRPTAAPPTAPAAPAARPTPAAPPTAPTLPTTPTFPSAATPPTVPTPLTTPTFSSAPAFSTAPPPAPASSTPALAPGDEIVKLTPLRRSIAQRMSQSKREIPHAYGVNEVDLTTLVRWRELHKDQWRAREGVNVTFTAFFVKAAAEALKAFPFVNASWREEGILLHKSVNMGIGIALEDGLIVTVLKHADEKNTVGIAQELDTLSRKAREGKLSLDDVQGGTFTITNPGVFGSIWSMPIIVPGQAAILATDAIVKRPVVRDNAIAIRDIMHLGLSFDHRIFDGAVAVQFLNRIKEKLEQFPGGDAALTDF